MFKRSGNTVFAANGRQSPASFPNDAHPLFGSALGDVARLLAFHFFDGSNLEELTTSLSALRRQAYTARSLPNRIAERFHKTAAPLPRSTEAERLVVQRVGQQLFRDALLDYWQGRCPVTGLAIPSLLRASHIKPWAACNDDDERLDIYNGLLLAPQLDALFDGGWATFEPSGELRLAEGVQQEIAAELGLVRPLKPIELSGRHQSHLVFHRLHVFRTQPPAR